MGVDLLKLMPDAMLWTYAPGQPQLPAASEAPPPAYPLVVLDFVPNPKWSPPSLPSEALTGLKGRVWIDPRSRRVVRLESELFHAVNIGLGFVAHIYPPGNIEVQQTDAGSQRWLVEHIDEQINLRALMVKNIREHVIYENSNIQTISAMTYQEAIKLLLATPLPDK
jgi:hypothetical protein